MNIFLAKPKKIKRANLKLAQNNIYMLYGNRRLPVSIYIKQEGK